MGFQGPNPVVKRGISEMNGKGCKQKEKSHSKLFLDELKNTTKNLSQERRSLGRNSNLGPLKYEGVLTSIIYAVCAVYMQGAKIAFCFICVVF